MQIVYVLVTDGANYIPEMCAVSAAAAKRYAPGFALTVVMDRWSHDFILKNRKFVLNDIDNVVVVERIHENAAKMSRQIKTSLRRHVTGDFLFIDVDAVPVQDISALARLECDFAATQNGNCPPSDHVFGAAETEVYTALNWAVPPGVFLNSGVFFARDCPAVHAMFDRWHALWRASAEMGFNKDQPALNVAIQKADWTMQLLPPQWNAMISLYIGGGFRPKIVHYSTIRFDERNDTVFNDMVRQVRVAGSVDLDPLERAREKQFYWTDRNNIKYQLKSGNYVDALRVALYKRFGIGRPLP